jgi:hypothetical protein
MITHRGPLHAAFNSQHIGTRPAGSSKRIYVGTLDKIALHDMPLYITVYVNVK